jgi:hypothetical protein
MDELTGFLSAQVELDAVSATMRTIHAEGCDHLPSIGSEYTYPCDCGVPERMMREAEAKRMILAAHDPSRNPLDSPLFRCCPVCITERGSYPENWTADDFPCTTMKALISVYSDRPGYRQEWGVK